MGDVNEIKVGIELLDYTLSIFNIMTNLSKAKEEIDSAFKTLEGAYIGDAQNEINMYLVNFSEHINKMNTLYQSLMIYIQNVFDSMDEKDDALSEWFFLQTGYQAEVKDGEIVAIIINPE